MGKREDFIKQTLADYESPVDIPTGWNALEQLLEQPVKKKKPYLLWFSICALIFTLGTGLYWLSSADEIEPIADASNVLKNNSTDRSMTPEMRKTNEIKSENTSENSAVSRTKITTNPMQAALAQDTNEKKSNFISHATIKLAELSESYQETRSETFHSEYSYTAPENIGTRSKNVNESQSIVSQHNTMTRSAGILLPIKSLSLLNSVNATGVFERNASLNLSPRFAQINTASQEEIPVIPVQNPDRFMLTLESGLFVHNLQNRFSLMEVGVLVGVNDFARTMGVPAKLEFVAGYNFGLNFTYNFHSRFFIGTGLNYQSLKSKLSGLYTQFEERNEEVPSLIVNSSRGEMLANLESTTLAYNQTRELQHFNSLNIINIPINLGHRFNLLGGDVTGSVGVGINYISSANGRYFTTVSSVSDISKEAPYRQGNMLFSMQMEMGFHKSLTNSVSAYTGLKGGRYLSNINANTEFESRLLYLAWNIGLSKTF